jgi:hypothetical protein
MKTAFALAAVFLCCTAGSPSVLGEQSQLPEPPQLQMPPTPGTPANVCRIPEAFDLLNFESGLAHLEGTSVFLHDRRALKSASQARTDFESWLKQNKGGQCYPSISKYAPALTSLLDGLRSSVGFLYAEDDMPFKICAKEKSEGLILSAVASDQIYNTLRLDPRQRGAKEFESTAIPILLKMRTALLQTQAQFYGVVVVYGARDFSRDELGGLAVQPEVLAVVTDRENGRSLDEGKITEDEFADKSDIYLRVEGASRLVKVRLKFE